MAGARGLGRRVAGVGSGRSFWSVKGCAGRAPGRGAFEARHYSEQEFLDREYDYKLDFFLQGNQWKYVQLSISILDWSKRIQRVDF